MAKVIVMKNGQPVPQDSAERVAAELESLRNQLADVVGTRTDEKGKAFPENSFVVSPDTKAKIVDNMNFIRSAVLADKKMSNTGRDPKADLPRLERIYVDYMRANPDVNRGVAAMNIAVQYNQGAEIPVDQGYVQRTAGRLGWDSLVNTPESATA